MSEVEEWTASQHYAAGKMQALDETYAYLLQYGPDDLGDWLKRRARGFEALLPEDEYGNKQHQPSLPASASGRA